MGKYASGVRIWDVEEKEPVETIELGYLVTAVA
jgi:hypothetical protein